MNKELVSCLCVTDGRVELLKHSVRCFFSQCHESKELVVVYNPEDFDTKKYIETLDGPIKLVPGHSGLSLGELRNISIQEASGEYICVWDDDDWHHPNRITRQLNAAKLHHKSGCILETLLLFDCVNDESYMSFRRPWEGTLLVKKDVITTNNIRYPSLNLSEDTAFSTQLFLQNCLYPLNDPCLYVYHVTGNNSWPPSHFKNNLLLSDKLPTTHTAMLKEAMKDSSSDYSKLDAHEFQCALNFFVGSLRVLGLIDNPAKKIQEKKPSLFTVMRRLFIKMVIKLSVRQAQRTTELEKEVQELRLTIDKLRKVAASSAQAKGDLNLK